MGALRVWLGLLIILLVVGVGVYLVLTKNSGGQKDGTREEVAVVSNFTFPDRFGNPVTFSSLDARVRVIHFWASWSPYSATELPALVKIKNKYGKAVEIVALNRDTAPGEGRVFFDSLGLGSDLVELYDEEDGYYKSVGGYNMPETVFVDSKDRVLVHIHGPMTYDDVVATLDRLLQ